MNRFYSSKIFFRLKINICIIRSKKISSENLDMYPDILAEVGDEKVVRVVWKIDK